MAKVSGFRPEDLFANNTFITPEAGAIGSCPSHCPLTGQLQRPVVRYSLSNVFLKKLRPLSSLSSNTIWVGAPLRPGPIIGFSDPQSRRRQGPASSSRSSLAHSLISLPSLVLTADLFFRRGPLETCLDRAIEKCAWIFDRMRPTRRQYFQSRLP